MNLRFGQVWTRITRLVKTTVSGIDDGAKNLINLVHQVIGNSGNTERLCQREILGPFGRDVRVAGSGAQSGLDFPER